MPLPWGMMVKGQSISLDRGY